MSFEPTEKSPEYTFDFNSMETTSEIAEMHQEGNYLIGTTVLGVKFNHRIPQGKILNKKGGRFILEDVVVA